MIDNRSNWARSSDCEQEKAMICLMLLATRLSASKLTVHCHHTLQEENSLLTDL